MFDAKKDVAGGISPDDLDTFHEMILVDELSRCGAGGVVWAIMGGLGIGMPPVSNLMIIIILF